MSNNLIYDYWLASKNVPLELKQQMSLMSDEEIKESFVDDKIVFGTAGYRAVMGPGNMYLNEFTYQRLAYGYAMFLKSINPKNKIINVVVAHDTRKNSTEFSMVVARTLTSLGINVYLFQNNLPTPTPLVSFTIRHLKLDGGINITASHNPKEYNGFKAYNKFGSQLLPEEAEIVTKNCLNWKTSILSKFFLNHNIVKIVPKSIVDNYFSSIKSNINYTHSKISNFPIVITTHHGALSNKIYFDFLKSLGNNIVVVKDQCFYDEDFINSPNMNPEDNVSFNLSIIEAEKQNASVVLGFDPDGDRLAVGVKHCGKWVFLNGNESGIIATDYLLSHFDNKDSKVPIVISTHVSNNLINNIVEKYDGLVLRTKTGFKNIGLAMEEINNENSKFIVAFEEAIGMCIDNNIREKDGLAAAALMIEIVKYYHNLGMTLVDVLNKKIYVEFGNWFGKTVSIKFDATKNIKETVDIIFDRILNSKLDELYGFRVKNISMSDAGDTVDIMFDDNRSWIKFRASGTEPKFKMYFNLYFDEKNSYNIYDCNYDVKSEVVSNIVFELKKKFRIK